jgi:hypothetical protein
MVRRINLLRSRYLKYTDKPGLQRGEFQELNHLLQIKCLGCTLGYTKSKVRMRTI